MWISRGTSPRASRWSEAAPARARPALAIRARIRYNPSVRRRRFPLLFPLILLLSAAADRASKLWAQSALPLGESRELLPGVLTLRLAHNRGMALGLLAGFDFLNLLLPVLAVAVGYWALRRYERTLSIRCASALVLGGFLGNLIDRVLLGYVVDMIYFPFLPFFVCNVADICITAGVVWFAVSLLFRPQDWRERHAKDDPPRAA